ncbi:hypothetical protein J4558_22280 [Leptolyngbya sp. 15MV]|nr:hypothetical protein J4558_22280 [Leptolyngbya sp. 15MV]
MRFVALAVIFLSLPVFVAWLGSSPRNRDRAVMALGALLLVGGSLQTDASIISWPMWTGTSRGIIIGFEDMLALAILLTRRQKLGMPGLF